MLIVSANKFFLVTLFSLLFANFAMVNDAFLQSIIFFTISLFLSLIIYIKNYQTLLDDIKFLYPLITICLTGILFSSNNLFEFAIRDLYYFCNHIIIILFGFQLAKIFSLKDYIISLTWLSFSTFIFFYFKLAYLNLSSLNYIQEFSYTAAYASLFPLAITSIFLYKYLKIGLKGNLFSLMILFFFVHIIVIDSRTSLVSLLIYFSSIFFLLTNQSLKSIARFFISLSVFLFIFFFIGNMLNAPMIERFYDTFNEFNPNTRFNYLSDVNLYWRAYESYVSLFDYLNLSLINQVFGAGFGKEVFLGFEINLGGSDFSKIYVFHNGYINLLLKTGIIGFMLYTYFFVKKFLNYRQKKHIDNGKLIFVRTLLSTICLLIIFITIPIAGLMNISIFPIALSFGFLAHKEKIYTERLN